MRNKQIKISESTFAALKKIKQNYVLDTVTTITALYCTKARTAQ